MEHDPAAAAIEAFRDATRCSAALREANLRAVRARVERASTPAAPDRATRVWVIGAVALAAAFAAMWYGARWWSHAGVVAQRTAPGQAVDLAAPVPPASTGLRAAPASLPSASAAIPAAAPIAVESAPRQSDPPRTARPGAPAPVATDRPSPAAVAPAPDALAQERRLLVQAKDALHRNDHAAALAALDRHAEQHPSGMLAEDRWTLRVLVHCAHDDLAAARTAATAFARAVPASPVAARLVASPCGLREIP